MPAQLGVRPRRRTSVGVPPEQKKLSIHDRTTLFQSVRRRFDEDMVERVERGPHRGRIYTFAATPHSHTPFASAPATPPAADVGEIPGHSAPIPHFRAYFQAAARPSD